MKRNFVCDFHTFYSLRFFTSFVLKLPNEKKKKNRASKDNPQQWHKTAVFNCSLLSKLLCLIETPTIDYEYNFNFSLKTLLAY